MNWENVDPNFTEDNEPDQALKPHKEPKIQSLLQKFKDPSQDPKRQEYIQFLKFFNHLLVSRQTERIAYTLINEDTQSFLLSSARGLPAKHSIGPKGFLEIYKDRRIVERYVRQVYVDQEKCTAIQICSCIIEYQGDEKLHEEFSFEIFTIKENKISKYRASYGSLTPAHNREDPFVLTRKDKMLAKVKMINYALAGQPDFDKVASLLHEKTEYTILSWEADQFHTFYQHNFATEFKNLEVKFNIKCIVPYELYTDMQEIHNIKAKIVVSTYAYHLEEKMTGKPYVWLSTCAYAFDQHINITKVSQQGELYPEGETEIPFESYDREKITQKTHDFFKNLKANLDIFYSDIMQSDCTIHRLGPHDLPTSRHYHGIEEIKELMKSLAPPEANIDWIMPVDIFVDLNDPSYDVVVLVLNAQGTFHYDNYKYQGQHMNFLKFVRLGFENGKVAKFIKFLSEVPYPILSPFDDETAVGVNFRQPKDFENMSVP